MTLQHFLRGVLDDTRGWLVSFWRACNCRRVGCLSQILDDLLTKTVALKDTNLPTLNDSHSSKIRGLWIVSARKDFIPFYDRMRN